MKESKGGREIVRVGPRTRRDDVTGLGHLSRCHGGEVMGRRLDGTGSSEGPPAQGRPCGAGQATLPPCASRARPDRPQSL